MRSDPRANPPIGSEFISGQITDKALALFDLLNQVTGTEGGNFKTFDIDGEDLALGLYRTERDADAPAWERGQTIYFQDSAGRLTALKDKLQENFDRLQNDITSNISSLFDLINEPEGTGEGQGGVDAGEDGVSILQEIQILADDPNVEVTELEDKIHELLTSEAAINRLVDALFANFQLDIQRLDEEIFDLLNDGDDIFSNSGDSDTDTTSAGDKYLLSLGSGEAKITLDDHPDGKSHLEQAFDITMEFLQGRHEEEHGAGSWNESAQLAIRVSDMFQKGQLTLDPLFIEAIIEEKFSSDADLRETELERISSHRDFLKEFRTLREFMDFARNHYETTNDNETFKELFIQDLANKTPKYIEDQRSLLDVLKGKADDDDNSSFNKIFQGAGDKVEAAALGAVEVLGSGFDKLSTNNFEAFVRDNPVLLIEHLLGIKTTASSDETVEINKQITALKEFQSRQLNNFNSWLKEKSRRLNKAKFLLDRLGEEKANPSTSTERAAEIDEKIALLIKNTIDNDTGLEPSMLRTRASFALAKLTEIRSSTTDPEEIETIDHDISLIEASLLETDANIAEHAIRNSSAAIINKVIATDIAEISNLTRSLGEEANSITEDQAIIDQIKLAYNNHDFLQVGDLAGMSFSEESLDEAIDAIIRTKNTHAALYASETLEAGKINARFTTKKLSTPDADGNIPEDNQLAPPQISPTPLSAAIAAIGNQILFKANNLIHDTQMPDETWIDDNAAILNDINTQIAADPSLSSAGAVFFTQLREGFKTTITNFFNSHSGARAEVDDAKTAYRFVKNLEKSGNIGGSPEDILENIENSLDWVGSNNLNAASDKIFIDGYKDSENYIEKKGLVLVQEKLRDLADGSDTSLNNLNRDISDANREINLLTTRRERKVAIRNFLISSLSNLPIDPAAINGEIADDDDLDDLGSDDGSGFVGAINAMITNLNTQIRELDDGSNGINYWGTELSNAQAALSSITTRAQSLLNGSSSRVSIDDLVSHLDGHKDQILEDIANQDPAIPGTTIKKQLKNYTKKLSKDYSDDLVGDTALADIQTQLNQTLTETSLDLNSDGVNDFVNISNVINKIDNLASDITNVFGEKEGKAQTLGQLSSALKAKQDLETELADPNTGTERREEIEKILYGFEEVPIGDGLTETVIGTASDRRENSLLTRIEDLKVRSADILEQPLPSDENELIELLDDKRPDYTSIEQQSIKRLILLMFVLSMLEYSDWDYRKQEADPSRYAVF